MRHPLSTPLSITRAHTVGTPFQGTFDINAWIANHTPEHTGKRVRQVIEGLKGKGITVYGVTGYCYGGATPTSAEAGLRDAESISVPHSPPYVRSCVRKYHSCSRHCPSFPFQARRFGCASFTDIPVYLLSITVTDLRREEQSSSPDQ